jgi:hypothetical protein
MNLKSFFEGNIFEGKSNDDMYVNANYFYLVTRNDLLNTFRNVYLSRYLSTDLHS